MIKSELATRLATRHPHLSQEEAEHAVTTVLNEITAALASGGRVELRGFGTFSSRIRQPRSGRNPRTGAPVAVPMKRAVFFRAGKNIHARLNR